MILDFKSDVLFTDVDLADDSLITTSIPSLDPELQQLLVMISFLNFNNNDGMIYTYISFILLNVFISSF
jgi:hypothetical protein